MPRNSSISISWPLYSHSFEKSWREKIEFTGPNKSCLLNIKRKQLWWARLFGQGFNEVKGKIKDPLLSKVFFLILIITELVFQKLAAVQVPAVFQKLAKSTSTGSLNPSFRQKGFAICYNTIEFGIYWYINYL